MQKQLILSGKELSNLVGVTVRTLQTWAKAGASGFIGRGKWDLLAFLPWFIEHIKSSEETPELKESKARYWAAKSAREELRVEQEKSGLIPKDQATQWLIQIITEAKNEFLSVPRRMAPILYGKEIIHIEQDLRAEIYRILSKLSNAGGKR